jgi:hypothetical protein
MDYAHYAEVLLTALTAGVGAWTGIKARIARLEAADKATDRRLEGVSVDVSRAHMRIDSMLQKR